jgi:hypothetical protein
MGYSSIQTLGTEMKRLCFAGKLGADSVERSFPLLVVALRVTTLASCPHVISTICTHTQI